MKLKNLLQDIQIIKTNVDMEMEVSSVAYDSRKVVNGGMFVTITGFATDGNKFIPMAMEKGAAVVVTSKQPADEVPFVQVASDRLALALIGCNYYGRPGESMKLIGVTGTNGKTSSTLLLKHVLEQVLGAKVVCVLIGERPGLATAESMSAYIVYNAYVGMPESKRTVVSNIHKDGLPAVEAGAYIVEVIDQILQQKASGVDLVK